MQYKYECNSNQEKRNLRIQELEARYAILRDSWIIRSLSKMDVTEIEKKMDEIQSRLDTLRLL